MSIDVRDTQRFKAEAAFCTNTFTSMMETSTVLSLSAGNKRKHRDNNNNKNM